MSRVVLGCLLCLQGSILCKVLQSVWRDLFPVLLQLVWMQLAKPQSCTSSNWEK